MSRIVLEQAERDPAARDVDALDPDPHPISELEPCAAAAGHQGATALVQYELTGQRRQWHQPLYRPGVQPHVQTVASDAGDRAVVVLAHVVSHEDTLLEVEHLALRIDGLALPVRQLQ